MIWPGNWWAYRGTPVCQVEISKDSQIYMQLVHRLQMVLIRSFDTFPCVEVPFAAHFKNTIILDYATVVAHDKHPHMICLKSKIYFDLSWISFNQSRDQDGLDSISRTAAIATIATLAYLAIQIPQNPHTVRASATTAHIELAGNSSRYRVKAHVSRFLKDHFRALMRDSSEYWQNPYTLFHLIESAQLLRPK